MALTPKQEKFVRALVKGESQREAYRNAFECTTWKESSIDSKACNLFKTDKIKARYNELMEEVKEEALWDVQKSQEKLLKFLTMCENDKDKKHALGYIKELNSLLRLYDTESKHEKIEVVVMKHED